MITIVGNKCDLERKVDYDKPSKYAQENNCNYVEVSAYSGHNIKSMFFSMVQEVFKKTKSAPAKPDDQHKKNTTSVLVPPSELGRKPKKACKC